MDPENAPSRDHECGLRRSDTELESAVPPTDECGLRRSQSIRELPSRFKDYGRVRLGIFRKKNVFRNIFRLFCPWEQNSQNGIQVFRNENSSQTNAYLHYSNYSYSGLIPNERALCLSL